MQRREKGAFESWLAGELVLVLLLGASAALFLTSPNLSHTYFLPEGRLVLDTAVVLAATVVAILAMMTIKPGTTGSLLLLGAALAAGLLPATARARHRAAG